MLVQATLTATTDIQRADFFADILFVTNDGANDVRFDFGAIADDTGGIVLKPGETLSFSPRLMVSEIYYKASTGTATLRIGGMKYNAY